MFFRQETRSDHLRPRRTNLPSIANLRLRAAIAFLSPWTVLRMCKIQPFSIFCQELVKCSHLSHTLSLDEYPMKSLVTQKSSTTLMTCFQYPTVRPPKFVPIGTVLTGTGLAAGQWPLEAAWIDTLPETNIFAPENGILEYQFPFQVAYL